LTRQVGLQGIRSLWPPAKPKCSSLALLSWARTLLQSASSSKPPRCHLALSGSVGHCGSSHEVSRPFSVSPLAAAASFERLGLPHPTDLRPQVISTSRRLSIRREPAGLISCRIRSWGSTLQSFAPAAWLYAVSSAVPLLTLVPSRHHLVRLRRPPPPEGVIEPPSRSKPVGRRNDLPSRVHPFPQSRNPVEAGRAAHPSEAEASLVRTARLTPPRPKPQRSQTRRPSRLGRSRDKTEHDRSSLCRPKPAWVDRAFASRTEAPSTPAAIAREDRSPRSQSPALAPFRGAEAPFWGRIAARSFEARKPRRIGHLPAPP
jgi:hypothetical protein